MRLNEEHFETIEEFFDLVPNADTDPDIEFEMSCVRDLLREDIYELNSYELDDLASEILHGLEAIWNLIPDEDKEPGLQEYYQDLVRDIESGPPFHSSAKEHDRYAKEPDHECEDDDLVEEYHEREEEEDEWD